MPTSNFQQPMGRTVEYIPLPVTPGPGHYRTSHGEDTRLRTTVITSSFKPRSRAGEEPGMTPGPADYENKRIELLQETRPAYTMRIRPEKEVIPRGVPVSISLGPAEYGELREPIPDIQTATWMKPVPRKFMAEEVVTPGPGDYLAEQAKDTTLNKAATYKLGLKTASGGPLHMGSDSPGPVYNPNGHIGKGMAKSFSAKDLVISDRNFSKSSTTPGPGAYLKHSSSQPILQRSAAYTWGAKQHANQNAAGRRSATKMAGTPNVGPGLYEAYPGWIHKKSPAYPMAGRPKKKPWASSTPTPGPNYMPQDKPKMEYTMQGKNDYSERMSEAFRNPGPGEYEDHEAWQNANHEKGYDKAKGWTMGQRLGKKPSKDVRKHGLTHEEPQYVASKSKQPPSYTIMGRPKQRQEATQPGPGHYNIRPTTFTSTPIKRLC